MAKTVKKKSVPQVLWQLPFEKQNYMILLIGLGTILLGYALMATGITEEPAIPNGKWNNPMAVYIAPTLLVIGYCVIIPFGIIKFFGKKEAQAE
ncbi:MAG: DUF3098 domain-containing protein [Candidatus Kapabacteria bacterium]|nr:DUF3098 domain-containing protein [Ignavibacteriota bacterium]MCW5886275.1 DUF3098 domain-containing protein [Candidatus Kapabacteria bacterium]